MRHLIETVERGGSQVLAESVNTRELVLYHGTKSAPFDSFKPTAATKGEQFWNPLGSGMYATDSRQFAGQFGSNVHKVVIPVGSTYRRINHMTWVSAGTGLVMRAVKQAFKLCGQSFDEWRNGVRQPAAKPGRMTREQMIDFLANHHEEISPGRGSMVRERAADKSDVQLKGYVKNALEERRPAAVRDRDKERKVFEFLNETGKLLRSMSPYEGLYEASALVEMLFGGEIAEAFGKTLPACSDAVFGKWDYVVFTETNDDIGMGKNGKSAHEVVIFNPALQKTVADNAGSRWS